MQEQVIQAPLFASRHAAVTEAISIVCDETVPRLNLILCALGATEEAAELMALYGRIIQVIGRAQREKPRRRRKAPVK